MKAYLFNTKSGLYEGESFEEPAMLEYEDGITTVPPPEYGQGQVPVFDREKQLWEVIQVNIARQLLNAKGSAAKERQL